MRVLSIGYALWKSIAQSRGFSAFHQVIQGDDRKTWCGHADLVYASDIDNPTDFADWSGAFATSLEVDNEDEAIARITGLGRRQVTIDGRPKVAAEKPDDPKVTLYTHDWTDPTTWYSGAVRVVDETATDSGNHLTYSLAHGNVIDTYHGLTTGEDFLKDADGHSYRVVVKVNGVQKTEQDPHVGSGGDYTIDYAAGTVTFLSALAPTDVVTVTYHYATTSLFTIAPLPGTSLRFSVVEVQFSEDVEITDTIIFQPYGFVDVFAPELLVANGGPLASGTKIPLGDPLKYKTISDYQNDAVRAYQKYPAMGGASWRGAPQPIIVFDWDYAAQTALSSAAGMEVRIYLEHEIPLGGWYCTATFYCTYSEEAL